MKLSVLVLPGDGIGKEIMPEAVKILDIVCRGHGHQLSVTEGLIGGASLETTGQPITEETLAKAKAADAVLMGAVGLPRYDNAEPSKRPERGLMGIRKAMKVFANLRPVKAYPALVSASPLKDERVLGADLLIVRELTGGLYFGTPRGIQGEGRDRASVNTMSYSYAEIERIARTAFDIAQNRRRRLTNVDKANVLETSQLWRSVVTEVSKDYPDVALDHLYVDNASMQLILRPTAFDVILTENLFGDILSDEAAVIGGSIGLLPSASLGAVRPNGTRPGLYEPIHGSAPDIAGKGVANPLGVIGSVALMLDWSFGLAKEAAAIRNAIDRVVAEGPTTPDLRKGQATTRMVGDAIASFVTNG